MTLYEKTLRNIEDQEKGRCIEGKNGIKNALLLISKLQKTLAKIMNSN